MKDEFLGKGMQVQAFSEAATLFLFRSKFSATRDTCAYDIHIVYCHTHLHFHHSINT